MKMWISTKNEEQTVLMKQVDQVDEEIGHLKQRVMTNKRKRQELDQQIKVDQEFIGKNEPIVK